MVPEVVAAASTRAGAKAMAAASTAEASTMVAATKVVEKAEAKVAVAIAFPLAECQFVWAPPVAGGEGPIHATPPGQWHPDEEFEVAHS